MKKPEYLRLFIILLLLFVFYNNLRADEKKAAPPENTDGQTTQAIQFAPAKKDDQKARQKQIAEEKARKEKQLKESLAAKEQEKQAKLKEAAQEKAGVEERKKSEAKARVQGKEQELAIKEAQRKAREEELEQKEAQAKARQEERLRKEAERRVEEAQARIQKEQEAQARRLKQEAERKASEEELARKEEEKLKREAERRAQEVQLKAQKEQEAQARRLKQEAERKASEEELVRKKEERLKEIASAKKEKVRKEAERRVQEVQLKDQKKKEAEAKRLKFEQEKRAREEELARKEEGKLKKEAERRAQEAQAKAQKQKEEEAKQAKLEQEKRAREEELARKKQEELEEEARQREERMEELARVREQRLEEFHARQEELAQEREARLEELSISRQEREAQLRDRQEELTRLETERQIQEAELQAQQEEEKQEELRERQEEMAKEKGAAQARINEAKKATTQEKVITEAMLKKQKEDQAKIEKIEKLWKRARKLYDQERYEEAIKDFQRIIELEGNPRIKYTPEAKEYIEKARINMEQKKQFPLYYKVDLSEKEMVNQVIESQIPPYLEPPKLVEQPKEPSYLIEPPPIRKKLRSTKITMDFDKVGFKSVMGFLAQESGINIVASQRVLELAPVVSARFKDATLDEVIKYIVKNLGLVYRVDKEIVWIASPEEVTNEAMETRIYYLNKGGGLFTEFTPATAGTSETGLGGSSAQINKVFTIEDTLKEIIPWPSDSKISYDKRLNALLVRNTPQNLQMLEDILYNMDIEPLQVLIEARFIEVDITDTKELGMDWNIAQGDWQLKDRNGTFKQGLGQNTGVDFTAFTRATEGFNLNYIGMLTNSQFKAVLHALEESKKIKTLSSPRITTLNNQVATIKVVDEWIYPTRYEFEILQVPGQLPSQTPTYEYKNVPKDFIRRDVGILLKVIPAVGSDKKTINLSLIPEVSEGIADGFTYTGDVKLPKFTSRNLSTSIVVSSGDTVVLGGMIKENRTKTLTKVPILGDLPFIGGLFKKDTDSTERKNLLIFVTAKVLSSSGEEVVVAQK